VLPLITIAISLGFLVGLVEGLYQVADHALTREPHWAYSVDVLWMAPLGAGFVMGVLGVGGAVASRLLPRIVTSRVVLFCLVAAAGYPLLRVVGENLHRYAALLLAAGIAARLSAPGRTGDHRGWLRLPRRFLPGFAVGLMLTAAIIHVNALLSERGRMAALPDAVPGAPNVLLIILDTVRNQNLGLYGYDRPTTPNMERIAAEGVTFDRAVSPSSWTLPAHASIFTGTWPHEHGAGWSSPLGPARVTLAEHLSGVGYATAGFVANLFYTSRESGLARGFVRYEDHEISLESVAQRSWLARAVVERLRRLAGEYDLLARKSANDVNEAILAWLDSRATERPFFIFANYYDAHGPYLPPAPYDTIFGPSDPVGWLAQEEEPSEAGAARLIHSYDAALAYLDDQVGRLIDEVRRRGLLANTVVVITSDHGEEFFEHGFMDHGNSLYLPSLAVPLVIRFPPLVPAGVRVAAPVSLRDLAATIVDLAGAGAAPGIPGLSLAPLWEDSARAPDRLVLSEIDAKPWDIEEWYPLKGGTLRSIVSGRYHYIVSSDGSRELFDATRDRLEQDDLVGVAALGDSVARLDRLLIEAFRDESDSR